MNLKSNKSFFTNFQQQRCKSHIFPINSPKPWRVLETTFLLLLPPLAYQSSITPLYLDQTFPKCFPNLSAWLFLLYFSVAFLASTWRLSVQSLLKMFFLSNAMKYNGIQSKYAQRVNWKSVFLPSSTQQITEKCQQLY